MLDVMINASKCFVFTTFMPHFSKVAVASIVFSQFRYWFFIMFPCCLDLASSSLVFLWESCSLFNAASSSAIFVVRSSVGTASGVVAHPIVRTMMASKNFLIYPSYRGRRPLGVATFCSAGSSGSGQGRRPKMSLIGTWPTACLLS